MYFKVRTTDIDYYVSNDDVYEKVCEDASIEEDSEEYYDAIYNEVAKIKSELPQTMELEIECGREHLDDEVCEAISNEVGWLINSCTYKILECKSSKYLL